MGILSNIVSYFKPKTETVKTTTIKPNISSINVVDTTSGVNVKTETTKTPSGSVTVTVTGRRLGGGSTDSTPEATATQETIQPISRTPKGVTTAEGGIYTGGQKIQPSTPTERVVFTRTTTYQQPQEVKPLTTSQTISSAFRTAKETAGFRNINLATNQGGSTLLSGEERESITQNLRKSLFGGLITLGVNKKSYGLESFQASQKIQAGERFSESVLKTQEIESKAQTDLERDLKFINTQQLELNKQIEEINARGSITSSEFKEIENYQGAINLNRLASLEFAKAQGVTAIQTNEGYEISGKSFGTKVYSGTSAEQLAVIPSKSGRALRVGGELTRTGVEFGAYGLSFSALGGTTAISSVTGALPTTAKAGLITLGVGKLGYNVYQGARTEYLSGKELGVPTSSTILGGGKPLVATAGFIGGSALYSGALAEARAREFEEGKFTKSASLKLGQQTGKGDYKTYQLTESESKIPGTKLKISQSSSFSLLEKESSGYGTGVVKSTVNLGGKSYSYDSLQVILKKGNTFGFQTSTPAGNIIIGEKISPLTEIGLSRFNLGTTTKYSVQSFKGGGSQFDIKFVGSTESLGGEPSLFVGSTRSSIKNVDVNRLFSTTDADKVTGIVGTSQTGYITPSGSFVTLGKSVEGSPGFFTKISESGFVASKGGFLGGKDLSYSLSSTTPTVPSSVVASPTSLSTSSSILKVTSPQTLSTFTPLVKSQVQSSLTTSGVIASPLVASSSGLNSIITPTSRQVSLVKPSTINVFKETPIEISSSTTKSSSALKQSVKQATINIPSTSQTTIRATSSPVSISTRYSPPPFRPGGFGFPNFDIGRSGFTRRTIKTKRRSPPKREPSLLAIGLNIKSSKQFRGEFTGLGIRPILTSERRKKKKKKRR